MIKISPGQKYPKRKVIPAGFSLVELMVAMAMFLVIGGASLTLFSRHEALLSQEQGIAGLNVGLRNALAQLQLDVVNAGYGLILGANAPAWPVGVTIVNSDPTTTTCNPKATSPATYQSPCFDTLNIIMVDKNTPYIQPTNSCTTPLDTSATGAVNGTPAPGYYSQGFYSNFVSGDQILFVKSTGTQFTTAKLSAAATCPGCTSTTGNVSLTFGTTQSGGSNTTASGNDPYLMTPSTSTSLTSTFCAGDFIFRLLPITYNVSVATSTDPELVRTQGGVSNVVMDQVIGFKVGAATWNSTQSIVNFQYDYLASDYGSDFTLVRSVRVSLIGRTKPSTDPSYTYKNPFDGGSYQIRGSSIIVDPRNLTMNND